MMKKVSDSSTVEWNLEFYGLKGKMLKTRPLIMYTVCYSIFTDI